MKKAVKKYSGPLKKLSQALINIQTGLEIINSSGAFKSSAQSKEMINYTQQIGQMVKELEGIKSFILIGEDYINFCFLIIHGCDMADYLLTLKGSSAVSCQHALSWKKLVVEFRPLLQENANNPSHKWIP